jgi:hypothetical protein
MVMVSGTIGDSGAGVASSAGAGVSTDAGGASVGVVPAGGAAQAVTANATKTNNPTINSDWRSLSCDKRKYLQCKGNGRLGNWSIG